MALQSQQKKAGLARREIDIGTHHVPYLVGGQGEPLLLLHGFGADKDHWPLVAEKLTEHFTVYAPDIPGFGESIGEISESYTAAEQITRIRNFVEALGLNEIHIGGNSMGGYLAGRYAAKYGAQVKSLWLLAPAGVLSAQPSELMNLLDQGHNPLLVASPSDYDRLVEMCFTKPPYIPGPFKRCIYSQSIDHRDAHSKIFEDLRSDPEALEELLEKSEIPTLILWGDNDRILDPSGAAILAKKTFKREKQSSMEKMGHVPMLERPLETATAFLTFHNLK